MNIRVYRNAAIYPGTGAHPPAQALAVRGRTVLAVGSEADVREAAGPGAELIDLEGAAVLPGFYDAHIHTAQYAQSLDAVDLRDVRTLDEALTRVAAHAARLRPGAWLFGGRWDSNTWD
ncbi:amidohydrolase, partial [Nonomuraea mesophila]